MNNVSTSKRAHIEWVHTEKVFQSTLKMMFIKCLLFLFVITSVSALLKIWKFDDSETNERTLKTILQSCYGRENLSNGIFIYGDFDEVIEELPIVRLNSFVTDLKDNTEYHRKHNLFTHPLSMVKASVIVFIGDSPAELESFLPIMKKARFWDHMAPFFIIGRKNKTCEKATDFLRTAWRFNVLNAVHICSGSTSPSKLYTLNPITDYAPHPWERIAGDLWVFRQAFDPDISCQHLNYDKTKLLNGYQINAVLELDEPWAIPKQDYFEIFSEVSSVDYRAVRLIVEALNASCRLEIEKTREAGFDRCRQGISDLMFNTFTLPSNRELSFLFPHHRGVMVAVIKLNPEVSTLNKILHLWSPTVLIVAAVAIAILFLILTIKNHSPSFAMLDLTRLLIYSSILTNNRAHSFRIYFTTMLIFMVISNGVFQGKIAAFLTTRERVPAPKTIHELVKLQYKMYAFLGTKTFAETRCPECNFIEIPQKECIQSVLNSNLHSCAMNLDTWIQRYSLISDRVQESLNEELEGFKCRRDWPFHNRFNDMVMRFVESGILNHWIDQQGYGSVGKREALEAEWSSPEYRPVRLVKLDFAFQLLAIGLSLATIIFVLELIVSKFLTFPRTR